MPGKTILQEKSHRTGGFFCVCIREHARAPHAWVGLRALLLIVMELTL